MKKSLKIMTCYDLGMITCVLNKYGKVSRGFRSVPKIQKLLVLIKSLKNMTSYDLWMTNCDLKSILRYLRVPRVFGGGQKIPKN